MNFVEKKDKRSQIESYLIVLQSLFTYCLVLKIKKKIAVARYFNLNELDARVRRRSLIHGTRMSNTSTIKGHISHIAQLSNILNFLTEQQNGSSMKLFLVLFPDIFMFIRILGGQHIHHQILQKYSDIICLDINYHSLKKNQFFSL